MTLSGLQKTTLLDYPGKVACTVFTAGCNFRCPYCYNRDLVLGRSGVVENPPVQLSEQDFFEFLEGRRGILDAVVVCGGEPTLQPDLLPFLEKIKSFGFLTKLDTNGSDSTTLRRVVEKRLIDYVALDVKAPLESEAYATVVGLSLDDFKNRVGLTTILYSIELLVKGSVQFELRTTVVPGIHDKENLVRLAKQLQDLFSVILRRSASDDEGSPFSEKQERGFFGYYPQNDRKCRVSANTFSWYLQSFEPRTCLDPAFDEVKPFSNVRMEEVLAAVQKVAPFAKLRGTA